MADAPKNLVTEAEFARIQGLKPKYVRELRLTGRLVMDETGLILGRESVQRIRDTATAARAPQGSAAGPQPVPFANSSDFALIAGFKPGYVTQLKRDGRLVLAADGLIDVAASLARIRDTADPAKAGVAARHVAERAAKAVAGGSAAIAAGSAEADAGLDDEDAAAVPASAAPNSPAARRAESLAQKEHYLALAAQRDYEQSIGKLLNADDVASTLAAAATALRVRLETLADGLAKQLAAEPDEGRCRALISAEIEHALGELSRAFAAAQKPA